VPSQIDFVPNNRNIRHRKGFEAEGKSNRYWIISTKAWRTPRAKLFAGADCQGYTGRLRESMKAIPQNILGSSVPVAVYVDRPSARVPKTAFYLVRERTCGHGAGHAYGAASPITPSAGFTIGVDETCTARKSPNERHGFPDSLFRKERAP